jgi:hypothetical protein
MLKTKKPFKVLLQEKNVFHDLKQGQFFPEEN